jgi:large exoprotein involved in heme utilization and adhesion
LTVRDAGLVIGTGNGGTLRITTSRLLIRDGAEVSASSFGTGDGGHVIVRASESVDVLGTSPDGLVSSRLAAETGRPLQLPNDQRLVETGDGGSLRITTGEMRVQENGKVIVDSRGQGRAGNLEVSAEAIALNRQGRLTAEATGRRGQAGSLSITTDRLIIEEGAAATVSSPRGQAGNLTITANDILLNDGELTANARVGSGANIQLRDLDLLLMQNGSLISAQASGEAGGGNIDINFEAERGFAERSFIVAVPDQDSDIVANAVRGTGGNIRIGTQETFGIEEREAISGNDTNDIDASSQEGVQGTVTINRPDVDPSQGLANLPTEPVNPQVDQRCQPGGASTSRFVETGQGGLPPNPGEVEDDSGIWDDLRFPQERIVNGTAVAERTPSMSGMPEPIVEAQGWLIGADNKIVLVPQSSTVTPYSSWRTPVGCQNSQ